MCKLDVLKFYGYVVGDEIHTTPSPQHTPANNAAPVDDTEVPVVVVGVVPRQANSIPPPSTPPQQHHQAFSSASQPSQSPASSSLPNRFSATQASVETQTTSSLEPHSSQEYESYYQRQPAATISEIDEPDHSDIGHRPDQSSYHVSTASRQVTDV